MWPPPLRLSHLGVTASRSSETVQREKELSYCLGISWALGFSTKPHSSLPSGSQQQDSRTHDFSTFKNELRKQRSFPFRLAQSERPFGTLRWVFIAVALGGMAVTIYARLDDWRRGQR
jgi:hypothetical protein